MDDSIISNSTIKTFDFKHIFKKLCIFIVAFVFVSTILLTLYYKMLADPWFNRFKFLNKYKTIYFNENEEKARVIMKYKDSLPELAFYDVLSFIDGFLINIFGKTI